MKSQIAISILVAIVTAALTSLGSWMVQNELGKSERLWSKQSLASAFIGELTARVEQAQRRQKHYGNILSAAKKGDVNLTLNMPTQRSATIYLANSSRLGILGPELAKQLAFLYQLDGESDEYYRILGRVEFVEWAPDHRETFLGWGNDLEIRIEKAAKQLIVQLENCVQRGAC